VKVPPCSPPWDQQSIAEALALVFDEQPWSRLRKQTMAKKVKKLARRGQLTRKVISEDWAYRLCAASLMQHKYHWYGWEWRNDWAAQMCTKPWCYPRWDGSKCRVLVVAEQGIGDEIVFASCYRELAEDVEEAWIEMEPRLIPIMARSMPPNLHFVNRYLHDRKMIVPRISDYPERWKEYPIDAFILAGNVPKLYRHSQADFPKRKGFLLADEDMALSWLDWLWAHGGERNGCSWLGRQGEIPRPNGGVSLQYGKGVDHGYLLVPPIDLKWDIGEVFDLIAALGKVCTTTNAVAHMAGALGVPCDVIKPDPIYATPDNLFNNRVSPWWPYDKSDWYPSIRMWRNYEHYKRASKS